MYRFNEYETQNTKLIISAATDAMLQNKMVGIIGYPGAGKSRSIEIFRKRNDSVYSIELGKSITGKEMYRRILCSINRQNGFEKLSSMKLMNQIETDLKLIQGKSLIIVDEAGFFSKEKIGYLLELYNLIWRKSGILVLGPQYYESDMRDWMQSGVRGVEEFYSRISYFTPLERPSKEEIVFILKEEGLNKTKGDENLLKDILSIPKDSRTWRFIEHQVREYINDKSSK